MTPTQFARRPMRGCCFCAVMAGLLFAASPRVALAADIIFTIQPSLSTTSLSGSDNVYGPFVEQSAGSLTSSLTGHFLARFDPLNGTPTSLEFIGGHGYYQPQMSHVALPGIGGSGAAAATSNAGQTAGGEIMYAVRDLVWDFYTPAPLTLTAGVGPANQTKFIVLAGGTDYVTPTVSGHSNYSGEDYMDSGTWTLSESSGDWTLSLTDSDYTFPYDTGVEVGTFTYSVSLVSTAHYGSANVATVAPTETQAEALGGAGTVGGVSAEFSQPTGGGTFSVQQVENTTSLSQAAVAAAESNPIFALSTESFSADPQIWNVDFDGDLAGATVTLVFNYDPLLLPPGLDENLLGIWHYNSSTDAWDFGGTVDTLAHTVTYTTDNFSPFMLGVPEPSSVVLAGMGLLGLAVFGWRRRRRG